MSKKEALKAFVSQTGEKAKQVLDQTIQSMDQNEDGKFNLSDVSILADSVGNTVKKGTVLMKEEIELKSQQIEQRLLRPIFLETLSGEQFSMSKLIRIVERDKKYAEKEICQGSIGFLSVPAGEPMVNIFQDSIPAFGLTFYPNADSQFYYVNPTDRNNYIALDDYFHYLKTVRINELQQIAQDLGAKHFTIAYKEERTTLTQKEKKLQAKVVDQIEVHTKYAENTDRTIEIAADMSFPGHEPVMPHLKYMSQDPNIQNLIRMRLHETTPLLHQKFMLRMSQSSGMKESDGVKIDAILKKLKCSGNASVTSEVQHEARRYLEYEISF